jgi:hypothetical protein
MAYKLNVAGNLVYVQDGAVDLSTDLTLIGKNYSGFGQSLNENFVKLLENFSTSTAAPSKPIKGQLWYDTNMSKLKVYSGTAFVPVSSTSVSGNQPLNMGIGDMWYNTTTKQLSFWDGSSVILLGPSFTAAQQRSGIVVYTVIDTNNQEHTITCIYNAAKLVGFFSNDAFTLQDPLAISGFSPDGLVRVGFNQGTGINDFKFNVNALDSEKLAGFPASDYFKTGRPNVTDSKITIDSNDGLEVKVGNLRVDSNNGVILENSMTEMPLSIRVKHDYISEDAISISSRAVNIGTSDAPYQMNLYQAPTISTSVTTKSYVDTTVKANTVMLCIVIALTTTDSEIAAIVEAMAPANGTSVDPAGYPVNTQARVLCSYQTLATQKLIKVYRVNLVNGIRVWQASPLENRSV